MRFVRALLFAFAVLCPALAGAQDFPNRTIHLIVPFPPGDPNDIIARVVAQKMQDIVKQAIVIDNKSGQGGVLGTDLVAKAAIAPAKTPPQVVAALNKAAVEAMKDPVVVEKLASQGATLVGGTPDEFRAYIDSETKKWAKVIKDAGVQTTK